MSAVFDRRQGLIILRVHIWGPAGDRMVRLALDTGATTTVVNTAILVTLGYDPALSRTRTQMTTGSGVEYVPVVAVERLAALGETRGSFSIIGHTLPPSAAVDGLLGLDFRDRRLTIDFHTGSIDLG